MAFSPKAAQKALAASASLQANNLSSLSVENITYLTYCSLSSVWLCIIYNDNSKDDEHRQIAIINQVEGAHQAKLIRRPNQDVVVAVSGTEMLMIVSLEGDVLYSHTVETPNIAAADELVYFKGIARAEDTVYFGDSMGRVHQIDIGGMAYKAAFQLHELPVSDVVYTQAGALSAVVSADVGGNMAVFDRANSKTKTVFSPGFEQACTCHCLLARKSLIFAGHDNGMITIHDIEHGETIVTLQAHARPIYALSFDSTRTMLASVGQDCKCLVWQVPSSLSAKPTGHDTKIILSFSATIKDRMLTGVSITRSGLLCVACFDSFKMVLFHKT